MRDASETSRAASSRRPVFSFRRNATVSSHIRHVGRSFDAGQALVSGSLFAARIVIGGAPPLGDGQYVAPADRDVQRPVEAIASETRSDECEPAESRHAEKDTPLESRVPTLLRRGRAVAVDGLPRACSLVRGAYLVSLSRTPLSLWHLWTETDEWGYVDWSAHLAAGNWRDVPAWRSYFSWQTGYGSPEVWEGWYQKNAYFSGPLYPYGLAVLRLVFGSPVWPARILQLLLACRRQRRLLRLAVARE